MKTLLFMVTLLAMATAALGMEPPGVEWVKLLEVSSVLDVCESDNYLAAACVNHLFLLDAGGNIVWNADSLDFGWYYLKFQAVLGNTNLPHPTLCLLPR